MLRFLKLRQWRVSEIEKQRKLILDSGDAKIVSAALDSSFYMAMLYSAEHDPHDNPVVQKQYIDYFTDKLDDTLSEYMDEVNKLYP